MSSSQPSLTAGSVVGQEWCNDADTEQCSNNLALHCAELCKYSRDMNFREEGAS